MMFRERNGYVLADHVFFPELEYQDVFLDFPYLLKWYPKFDYKDSGEEERRLMREETEKWLRDILGEMIRYTDGSLNATVYVIMMDENGFADDFFLTVLKGEHFDGESLEFEKALHENFFGKIEISFDIQKNLFLYLFTKNNIFLKLVNRIVKSG